MTDRKPFIWDTKDPLAKSPGETLRANQALRDYANMGAGRSLSSLQELYRARVRQNMAEPIPGSPSESVPTQAIFTLKEWSSRYQWQARLEVLQELQRQEEEELWRERRIQVRQQDWQQGEELRKLVGKILDEAPNFIKTRRRIIRGEEGERDKEIITLALDTSLLVRAAKLASALQRLSAGLEVSRSHTELSGYLATPTKDDMDLEGLDSEQIRSTLAQLGVLASRLANSETNSGDSPDSAEDNTSG